MKFEAVRKETAMKNPRKGMALEKIPSEIRIDPLTGRTARICHFMELKWEKPDLVNGLVAGTEAWCPFCGDKVLAVTPCFPEELIAEGRLQKDDMVIFPNLAPYDAISAVATFGSRHYLPMTEFTAGHMAKAFGFAQEFFRRVAKAGHPEAVYHVVNWNYMPPAGSSLIHPHLQVFSSATAPNLMREEIQASKRYFEAEGTTYWDDLVDAEKTSGERYLGQIGRTHWMTTWAPFGVAGDVLAVIENCRSTLELTDSDFMDIGTGLSNLMAEYDKIGIYSFNMNFFTATEDDEHFRFHLVFSPRTYFSAALGTPDAASMRTLFNETVCMAFPEKIRDILINGFS